MRKLLVLSIAMLMLLLFSGTSFAVKIDDSITFENHASVNATLGTITGGPFLATVNGKQFLTFCVELGEELNYTSTFKIGDLSHITVEGGRALQPFAAYIYTMATEGSYSNAELTSVQYILWQQFGYMVYDEFNDDTKTFYTAEYGLFEDIGWKGLGNVKVINLLTASGANAQDVLVRVPEPGTVLLMGSIFLGLGVFGRRQFLKK